MHNALAHVPRRQHQMEAALIRTAFVQEDHRHMSQESLARVVSPEPARAQLPDQQAA